MDVEGELVTPTGAAAAAALRTEAALPERFSIKAIGMGADAISFSTLPSEWHSPYIYLDTEATLALVNEYLNPYVEDRVAEDLHICT